MTSTQRDAVSSPATGLLIFNTTTGTYNYYDGSAWVTIGGASSIGADALDFDKLIDAITIDANTAFALGNFDLNFDSNTLFIDGSENRVGIGTPNPSEALDIDGNLRVTGTYVDSSDSAGTSGQVLSSTGTGTQWSTLADASSTNELNTSVTLNGHVTRSNRCWCDAER